MTHPRTGATDGDGALAKAFARLPNVRHHGTHTTFGRPATSGDRYEEWHPIRHNQRPQTCCTCWRTIPPFAPGATKGTRYTKAYFDPPTGLYLCLACHAHGRIAA